MLLDISDRVAQFYERAADCHERVEKAHTADERDFFLAMEERWLFLAHHREETERIVHRTMEMARRAKRRAKGSR
jgi:hypothetical protein